MRHLFWIVIPLLIVTASTYASNRGILITPDEAGEFEYVDDFSTPQVFRDAFLDNVSTDCWREGAIVNWGPHRNRTVTYRFYGNRVIIQAAVEVQQQANGRNFGGRNSLYLSDNGLDWTIVANSGDQEADANGWQREPLTARPQQTTEFVGSTELWVRSQARLLIPRLNSKHYGADCGLRLVGAASPWTAMIQSDNVLPTITRTVTDGCSHPV